MKKARHAAKAKTLIKKARHAAKAKTLITTEDIAALANEAAAHGDMEMVRICGRALSGSMRARRECFRVILAARAMA